MAGRLPTEDVQSMGGGRHVGEAAVHWAGIVDVTGNAYGNVATLTTPSLETNTMQRAEAKLL